MNNQVKKNNHMNNAKCVNSRDWNQVRRTIKLYNRTNFKSGRIIKSPYANNKFSVQEQSMICMES